MSTADNRGGTTQTAFQVPVTVFVSVHAVDRRDATAIAEAAVSQALRLSTGNDTAPWILHAPPRRGKTVSVRAYLVMDTDTAARNGHLRIDAAPPGAGRVDQPGDHQHVR